MSNQNVEIASQLIKSGRGEQARPLLEQAIKEDIHNIRAWNLYADTCTNPKDKIRVWEACLRLNPGNPQAQQALQNLNIEPETPATPKLESSASMTPKRRGSCFLRGLLWGLIGLLAVIAAVAWWLVSLIPKSPEEYKHVQPVEYYLYVPKNYSADKEWPLFISLHGAGGNGLDCWYLWQHFAEKEGFILLCPSIPWGNVYDKDLGEATVWSAITEIKKEYRIQPRMFLNGIQLGGLFAQEFACDYPGYVSGLSLLSAPFYVAPDDFTERIPMLVVIGGREDQFSRDISLVFADELKDRGFDIEYVLLPDAEHVIVLESLNRTIDLFRKTIGKESSQK